MEPQQYQQPQIQQPQVQQAPAMALLYQTQCYYNRPDGGRSVFASKKVTASVFPGWIIVSDAATGQEINRMQLTPDTVIKNLMGSAAIKRIGGKKISMFEVGYAFMFYNPMMMLVSYLFALAATKKSKQFVQACYAAIPQSQQPIY